MLVSKVDPQSEAAEVGVIDGDIIIQIENNEIKNITFRYAFLNFSLSFCICENAGNKIRRYRKNYGKGGNFS